MSAPIAIRIRRLGRYFGEPIEMDGAERPREAFRALMRITGIELRADGDDPQVTVAAPGHVLRDISLDIEEGSVVCLAGPSGSGKSVLLKILAGVLPPTAGSVEFYGPVTALLSVGDNLDRNHTAREQIAALPYVASARPEDAPARIAEIIDFAGLCGFEDAPLRTYSTGMGLRLSVAMALCGAPPIVLIDDVLAVGDIEFQAKCIDRLHELKAAGTTMVLALSDEDLVQQVATRVVTLAGGLVAGDVALPQWAPRQTSGGAELEWQVLHPLPEDDVMAFRDLCVESRSDDRGAALDVLATFHAKTAPLRCRPFVTVTGPRWNLYRSLYPEFVSVDAPGPLVFSVRIPTDVLPSDDYTIGVNMVAIRGTAAHVMKTNEAVKFVIRRESEVEVTSEYEPGKGEPRRPLVRLDLPWEVEAVAEAVRA